MFGIVLSVEAFAFIDFGRDTEIDEYAEEANDGINEVECAK